MRRIVHVLTLAAILVAPVSHISAQSEAPAKVASEALRSPLPEEWAYTSQVTSRLPDDEQWWRRFADPVLDSLIARGMEVNFDVAAAVARMRIAESAVASAQSGYYPTLSMQGAWQKGRNSGAISGPDVPAATSSYFNLGATMNWEIDLFGKITSQVKNRKQLYRASRAEYSATMVSLAAQIATYYMNLRTFQDELVVTRSHLESQQKVVNITEARYEAGLASKLDVAQAKTVLYSTEAGIPALESSVSQAINALAILLSTHPGELAPMLATEEPLQPDYRQIVPAGVPADLLRRRPDIVAAEWQLAAAASAVGIAKKDFLPSLSLRGTIGTAAHSGKDLFKDNSLEYSIAPTLSWTLFDGFARKHAVRQADEQFEAQVASYNLTVLGAVQEVDNALVAYSAAVRTIDSNNDVLQQSTEAFHLSVDLYKEGLTAFSNVVDAQINCLTYANSLVAARGQALVALVDLYKALGGDPTVQP